MDRWRLALATVVGVEAAAATAATVYLVVGLLTEDAVERDAAVWELVAAGAVAAALWAFLPAALRGRRWARGPLLTWQLIGFPVSTSMVNSPMWALGSLLLVCSVVGLISAARPATFDDQAAAGV